MGRIRQIDMVAFSFTLYFAVTLGIFDNMFSRDLVLYDYFAKLSDHEIVWALVSICISILYLTSFLMPNQKWISVLASISGGLFFIVLGTAYTFSYPNIGAGLFLIVGVVCLLNISNIAISEEEIKEDLQV